MKKVIKDNYGDPITVETIGAKRIAVVFRDGLDEEEFDEPTEITMILEVNATIKLARALLKAALEQNDDE